ncbi:MAG: hypothetical protein ACOYBY_10930 [Dermatophilaceae bacterium]
MILNQVTVKRELAAGVHGLKFLNDAVQLVDGHCAACTSGVMVRAHGWQVLL